MNQDDFHRAVAKATGESMETIAQRGFVPLTPFPVEREPHVAGQDELLQRVLGSATPPPKGRNAA